MSGRQTTHDGILDAEFEWPRPKGDSAGTVPPQRPGSAQRRGTVPTQAGTPKTTGNGPSIGRSGLPAFWDLPRQTSPKGAQRWDGPGVALRAWGWGRHQTSYWTGGRAVTTRPTGAYLTRAGPAAPSTAPNLKLFGRKPIERTIEEQVARNKVAAGRAFAGSIRPAATARLGHQSRQK